MRQPILSSRIKLTDKECSNSELEDYFKSLEEYFIDASGNDLKVDKSNLKIEVENRFINPTRDISSPNFLKTEIFPFDLEIKLFRKNGLWIEMRYGLFWTTIVCLFFLTIPFLFFWIKGFLPSHPNYILILFLSALSIFLGGIAIIKSISFRRKVMKLYRKTVQTFTT